MADLMTVWDAAERAGVSDTTVQKHIQAGRLGVAWRGVRGKAFLAPLEVERWVAWRDVYRLAVAAQRQAHVRRMARTNGRAGAPMRWERDEAEKRARLFRTARGPDREAAVAALRELYADYNGLRLPMEERRLGVAMGEGNGLVHRSS